MGLILIVDDQRPWRDDISATVTTCGHTFAMASGGNQAQEMMWENIYAAVISDVQMPNGNGIELLQAARRIPSNQSTKFYVHSSEKELRYEGRLLFLPDMIPKTFPGAEFHMKRDLIPGIPDFLSQI